MIRVIIGVLLFILIVFLFREIRRRKVVIKKESELSAAIVETDALKVEGELVRTRQKNKRRREALQRQVGEEND